MYTNIDLYNYNLPKDLIAQEPLKERSESRMLVLHKKTGKIEITTFKEIVNYLEPNDCVVLNNTKVLKARLYGIKENGNAKIEIMLIKNIDTAFNIWQCYMKPGKRIKPGHYIKIINKQEVLSDYKIEVIDKDFDGIFTIKFNKNSNKVIDDCGHIPLPPYINRKNNKNDEEYYQTIYSKHIGSVAAPTAGLHFSKNIIESLIKKNIKIAELTLHVGAGTFKPVTDKNIENHKMHKEFYNISKETCDIINNTKKNRGRIVAIGTTTVRTLETQTQDDGIITPGSGETDIFIYPPYKFKLVNIILTNFHLPKSTLIMLVSAFAGREKIMKSYEIAIREKMRFYSYGDCMLII